MRTILVVDDDVKVTAIVDGILRQNDFRVLKADSPSEAFAVLTREKVQLIISDVHMPGLPGPELLERLRQWGIETPVVFISGDLRLDTVDRSLEVPRSSFLPKPFTAAELLIAVRTNL